MYKISSIESMLKTKSYLEHYSKQFKESNNNTFKNKHENIRGSSYYIQDINITSPSVMEGI